MKFSFLILPVRLGSNLRELDRPFFAPALGGSDCQTERLQSVLRPGSRDAPLAQRREERFQLETVARLKTVREIFVMIVARSEILREQHRRLLGRLNHHFAHGTGNFCPDVVAPITMPRGFNHAQDSILEPQKRKAVSASFAWAKRSSIKT